jgi:hypothetical protein
MSTHLSKSDDKSLSGWNAAITEAKERIKELKNSIKTLESLRDEGMAFPEPEGKRKRRKSRRLPQE